MRRVNHYTNRPNFVDRPRFELGTTACKAIVLANYTNSPFLVTPQRFELQLTGPKPVVLPLDERVIYLVAGVGIEPT